MYEFPIETRNIFRDAAKGGFISYFHKIDGL